MKKHGCSSYENVPDWAMDIVYEQWAYRRVNNLRRSLKNKVTVYEN